MKLSPAPRPQFNFFRHNSAHIKISADIFTTPENYWTKLRFTFEIFKFELLNYGPFLGGLQIADMLMGNELSLNGNFSLGNIYACQLEAERVANKSNLSKS